MASVLKVDDLRGNTAAGNITITSEGGSATMQLQQGVAKAWFDINQVGTTSLLDSFNCSSVTDSAVGQSKAIFTANMANSTWSVANQCGNSANDWAKSKYWVSPPRYGTASCDYSIYDVSAGWVDGFGGAVIIGDLA
jgi:hypothetical protein